VRIIYVRDIGNVELIRSMDELSNEIRESLRWEGLHSVKYSQCNGNDCNDDVELYYYPASSKYYALG
jgi:hypothetical protein